MSALASLVQKRVTVQGLGLEPMLELERMQVQVREQQPEEPVAESA